MTLRSSLAEFDVCAGAEVDVDAPGVVVAEIRNVVSGTMPNYATYSFSLRSFSSSTSMSLI